MLYRDLSQNVNAPVLSGHTIARADLTKSQRAALAAQVVLGEATLNDLTRRQICSVLDVSPSHMAKAISLSTATRETVSRGEVPLSDIPTALTTKTLRRVIRNAGVARVWSELEPMI